MLGSGFEISRAAASILIKMDASRERKKLCAAMTGQSRSPIRRIPRLWAAKTFHTNKSTRLDPSDLRTISSGVNPQHFRAQAKRLCISPDKRFLAVDSNCHQTHWWKPRSSWNLNPQKKGELDLNVHMMLTREQILKIKEMLEVKNKKKGDMVCCVHVSILRWTALWIISSRTSSLIVHTVLRKNSVVLLAVELPLTAPVRVLLPANDSALQKHQVNRRVIRVAI
ncbi:hypothetical protein HYFRA_00009491 [Hymenoscyphus fraxineus]|uniref:Uncharacterized protein n=1 Tax=Hymenoscyphus fraxineus TaxID=746836 RepID=A0A9N9PVF4_9HELO|nr:hypothetical protein HYFRA_00009491 [Hymenoscyphus fraxineus]